MSSDGTRPSGGYSNSSSSSPKSAGGDVPTGKQMSASQASLAASRPRLMQRYDDYGTVNNICDVILGVCARDEWICPLCKNTGEGEGGYPLDAEEREEHEMYKCPKRIVQCPSCGKEMTVKERAAHVKTCTGPVVTCERCGAKIRKCYEENHLLKCVPFGKAGSIHLKLDPLCTVTQLMPGGAAEEGGVRVGDVICRVHGPLGGAAVASRDDFLRAIGPRSGVFRGTAITMYVLRDPEMIYALRSVNGDGDREASTASIRSNSSSFARAMIPLTVTVGEETSAARENRRRKLQRLQKFFPDINLDMVDELMTDPVQCRKSVLEAFVAADEAGHGALGPLEMVQVFRNVAAMTGIDPPSERDCKAAFRELDVEGSGLLTFDEFFPYLRSMIMEVVWAEGPLTGCPRCGYRVRERNLSRHIKYCCGDIHPRGSFHFDITTSEPLEIHSVGPAARAAGINEGDILVCFNGKPVKTRSELARVASPAKGCVAGSRVQLDLRRRGTHTIEKVQHVMFPLAEPLVANTCERLVYLNQKKMHAAPAIIRMLLLNAPKLREAIRPDFELADEQGNGYLDRGAVRKLFKNVNGHLGLPLPAEKDMDLLFDKISDIPDGSVSFHEFFPVLRIFYITELERVDKEAHLDGFR